MERCAVILFASAEPVPAAVAFATAAVEDSPWNNWDVQSMTGIVHITNETSKLSRETSDDEGPRADVNGRKHRNTIPQDTPIDQEKGSMARECVEIPSGSKDTAPAMDKVQNKSMQRGESKTRSESDFGGALEGQRQREEGTQKHVEEKTPSPREGVTSHSSPRANDALRDAGDMFRHEPSPLSSPEGLVAPRMWEEIKGVELGETIDVDGAHEARGSGSNYGGGGDTSCPRTPGDVRGDASGAGDDDPAPQLLNAGEAAPLATGKRPEAATRQQPEDRMHSTSGMKTSSAPAATTDDVEAAGTNVTSNEQHILTARSGNYSLEQGDETRASEHQNTRDQAKRLALEVARLRSSLRATTSELNTERSTRVRLEDEWWRRMQEWEEKHGCLVASKQEAERAARTAEEDMARLLVKEKNREEEVASERLAQESRQEKADIAMKGVVTVQDRLIQALRTELELTDSARRAAQDNALEAKDQLRLYVNDFLLWRNRAKHLEALLIELGHAPQPGLHAEIPLSYGSPSSKEHKRPEAPQRQNVDDKEQEVDPRTPVAKGPVEYGGSMQAGDDANGLSIPEKYARYFETTTGGYSAPPSNAAYSGTQRIEGSELDSETARAAAAWSTRAAMTELSSSSSSSQAYFQRSMKAQQEISFRLGKDLARARADLQSIYESNEAKARRGGGETSTYRASLPHETDGKSKAASSKRAQRNGTGRKVGDSPSREDKRRVQDRTAVQGVATQDNVSAPAASFPEGSHMARVLAVLLGEDSTVNGTGVAGLSDASPPSLRLTDYPQMLQAVFGGGPEESLQDSAVTHRRRVMVSEAPQRGQTGQGYDEGRFPRQPRSHSRTLTEGKRQARTILSHARADRRHGPGATERSTHVHAHNRVCGGNGGTGNAGCRPQDKAAVEGASGIPDDVDPAGGRESRSLATAFRGYEAKSSLLQRWLGEKRSPSPSPFRAMPVTNDSLPRGAFANDHSTVSQGASSQHRRE
ncbi:unnamed protein product [Ectocarpus sp. CCAP 1310/34]|nr:unnamed protein product [Ectocarpus sp. CCAP 1310/34]